MITLFHPTAHPMLYGRDKMLKCFSAKQNYKLNRTVEDYMKSMSFNSYTRILISESTELKNNCKSISNFFLLFFGMT